MNLVIVESPAKAKTINKYLGDNYTVLASYGHIRDLPSKNGSVDPEQNFKMEWEVDSFSKKYLKEITDAAKDSSKIILATDPDREGEAIAWHVKEYLDEKKLLKDKEGTESMVFEMDKDIKRLETITDRFSKIGSKSVLRETDVVQLISQSVEYLKSRMPVNTLFTLDFPNNNIIIPVNSTLLEWVVENLVKNAVDAMKGKGEIKISITEDANNLILNIADTGGGIDRSILKNIFKPGVTSKKRGWGLGLSLSKRIVEEYHKGSIFVMQSEKGVGTTFCIQLPKNLNSTAS